MYVSIFHISYLHICKYFSYFNIYIYANIFHISFFCFCSRARTYACTCTHMFTHTNILFHFLFLSFSLSPSLPPSRALSLSQQKIKQKLKNKSLRRHERQPHSGTQRDVKDQQASSHCIVHGPGPSLLV
jgi:hypothetical protein